LNRRTIATIVLAGQLLLATAFSVAGNAAPSHPDPGKMNRMHHYRSEHEARLGRHKKMTPAQRHARMVRYVRERKARMHRHRALVKSQKRHEQ